MKRLAAVLALTLLLGFGGARLLAGDGSTEIAIATGCDPAEAIPSSGMLSLAYTAPSAAPHLGHDDYVLGGRIRWDSQAALDCIGTDADAAYEHEISFDGDFAGRIWRLEHTFPEEAQVYADELVNDHDGRTVLTLGVFRPEHLSAGVDYWFTLDTPLLAEPTAREHRFSLDGELGNRICSTPNAWCVERTKTEVRRGLIDGGRGFDVALGGCWSWEYDTVSPCPGTTIPAIDDEGDLIGSEGATASSLSPAESRIGSDTGSSSGDEQVSAPAGAPSTGPGSADRSDTSTSPSNASGAATTTTVASQAPPGATTTSTPSRPQGPGAGPVTGPGTTPTTTTPIAPTTTTPTTGPGSPVTTSTTVRPTPTTNPPAVPTPTTRPPATAPPTTRPPAVTTTTRPQVTTPPTTRPPTTAPPTTSTPPTTSPPTTSPPAVRPSFVSISATSTRADRVRVVAQINWPAAATAPTCVTTLDGAVVSIKECGSRLNVNLRGVSPGSHTIRVRACDQSVACTDSPAVVVTVG